MRRTVLVLAVLFMLSVVAGNARGQVQYTVTDLGFARQRRKVKPLELTIAGRP